MKNMGYSAAVSRCFWTSGFSFSWVILVEGSPSMVRSLFLTANAELTLRNRCTYDQFDAHPLYVVIRCHSLLYWSNRRQHCGVPTGNKLDASAKRLNVGQWHGEPVLVLLPKTSQPAAVCSRPLDGFALASASDARCRTLLTSPHPLMDLPSGVIVPCQILRCMHQRQLPFTVLVNVHVYYRIWPLPSLIINSYANKLL